MANRPSYRRLGWGRLGWLPLLVAIGLVLALLIYRAAVFIPVRFDTSGGTANPNRVSPESNSAGDPAQNAGIGDVGGVHDHP